MNKTKQWLIATAALVMVVASGCNSDISRDGSPVLLTVTNTQALSRIDLAPTAPNCNTTIGSIQVRATLKNPDQTAANPSFNDVRINSYRVSYVRTDGGSQVPSPFVRTMDQLIPIGGAATSLGSFLVVDPNALSQAPFVALQTNNGGRDPETGLKTVKMDVIVEVFGQTVAGERVSGTTRFPLDFCYVCNGCA
jgi:hypothetical protein